MAGNITFVQGKKKREELQLPILHFIAADDWIDKIGMDAFRAWLKFYTWCDRSDARKDPDNDVIPNSLNQIMKKLNVGKKKFYNAIIRPLWNYGFIDLSEYEESSVKGNKPVNIVVYEYPQNDISKKYEPLEKIRDYDNDYESNPRTFAKQGYARKKEKENEGSGGFIEEPGVVSQGNQGWFREETRDGFTGKHNNVSNSITNDSNDITNDSNHHQEEEELPHFDEYIKEHTLSPEEKEMMMTRVYERRDDIQAKNKTARYRYYDSVLQTIRESIRLKNQARVNYPSMKKDKLPKCLEEKEIHEKKQYDGEDEGLEEKDLEKEKKEFEKLLRMRKKKRTEEYKLQERF